MHGSLPEGLCCAPGGSASGWLGWCPSPGLLLLTRSSWDPGLLLVMGTMAALINAVVTSGIDSFSCPHPLLLLGLLQEMAAQQESCHLSHTKNMTYPAMVCSTERHVLCLVCGGVAVVWCFTLGLGRAVLPLCWAPAPRGSWLVHPLWAPRVVSAHLQKCSSLLAKNGYYFLKYCSMNSKPAMPFQHRVHRDPRSWCSTV